MVVFSLLLVITYVNLDILFVVIVMNLLVGMNILCLLFHHVLFHVEGLSRVELVFPVSTLLTFYRSPRNFVPCFHCRQQTPITRRVGIAHSGKAEWVFTLILTTKRRDRPVAARDIALIQFFFLLFDNSVLNGGCLRKGFCVWKHEVRC